MSTFTPRLQLKRHDGSDPFLRQDFVDNFNKIDAAPGSHVCTSASRPLWGAAQANRLIFETDTRSQWSWSGTAWLPVLSATNGWVLGATPGAYQGRGVAATYSLGSITTTRPGSLLLDMAAILSCVDTAAQGASIQAYVDGAAASGSTGFIQWTGSNNDASWGDYRTTVTKGYKAVNPGAHTIQMRVVCATSSSLSVHAYRLMASVTLINETSR